MKKTVSLFVILLLCRVSIIAQNQQDLRKAYEEFRKNATKEYNDFRDQANAEYDEFIRQAWKEFGAEPPIPVPTSPDLPKPPVFKPEDKKPKPDSIPFEAVIPAAKPIAPPQPVVPIPVNPIPVIPKAQPIPLDVPTFSFNFYKTACRIRLENQQKISLQNISEETVADAWTTLSNASYDPVIADCLHLRDELKLCDWGYFQLIQTIADKYYGTDHSNESTLFQVFILTQSGYKIRIARTNNLLVALVPFDHTIYSYLYMQIDGCNYYVINKDMKNNQFYVCNYAFPKEQAFSLQINSLPDFPYDATVSKTFASVRYPIQVAIETNQNLIDFFNAYPLSSEWNLYAKASLSERVKEQLYPVLKNSISGKSQPEAANILINFVQTAFAYQTDQEQFGYERPFFADETFYYPANNCKDRAILFSILVNDLLGLDVVLLHYPNHLSTAVRFNENVEGDYLMIDNQKYTLCDPTYIGADIGMEMPIFQNTKPEVVRI